MGDKDSTLLEKLFPSGTKWWEVVEKLLIAAVIPVIAILTYINTRAPYIIIDNYLALKVEVYINNEYRGQVPAESNKKFELFTDDPVEIRWEVIRQNNTEGQPVGDHMSGRFQAVDAGKQVPITNVNSKKEFYFFPVINNQTDLSCEIYVNYGKHSKDGKVDYQQYVGILNPQKKNVYTGYYKWIDASNVALICKDGQLYSWGDIEGKRAAELNVQGQSGISVLTLFIK